MTNTVFIYALKCPITGQTRYVGKARNPRKRLGQHLAWAEKGKDHRACWVRSVLAKGQYPILEILDEVQEDVWPQWEVAWIAFFREQGFALVNATAGGEGMNSPTAETRVKIGDLFRGKPKSPEHRAKIVEANKRRIVSEETRQRQSDSLKGKKKKPFSEEHKRRLSEAGKKRGPISEDTRKNLSLAQFKRYESKKSN